MLVYVMHIATLEEVPLDLNSRPLFVGVATTPINNPAQAHIWMLEYGVRKHVNAYLEQAYAVVVRVTDSTCSIRH